MYHKNRVYDLSFTPSKKGGADKPYLVFTLEKKHFQQCRVCLERLAGWTGSEKYLGKERQFHVPASDLFGNTRFGYGDCGFVTENAEKVSFHIELSEQTLQDATLTIHLLTQALLVDYPSASSNRYQDVDIETCCSLSEHGHSVGGYMSGQVREWIRRQWDASPHDGFMGWAAAHPRIISAMRQTWVAVTPHKMHRWAGECSGYITEDGRFILNCFGNACDIAIYPDNIHAGLEYESARFSCHNLDTAAQQVTLLAGLAVLCELSRADDS